MKTGRVVKDYRSAYPEPLVIKAGESLTVHEKVSEWAGWVWCVNDNGKGAWVPEAYVERVGDRCKVLCDYSSRELNVRKGELLSLIKEESGWVWCENSKRECGWVPGENVEVSKI